MNEYTVTLTRDEIDTVRDALAARSNFGNLYAAERLLRDKFTVERMTRVQPSATEIKKAS